MHLTSAGGITAGYVIDIFVIKDVLYHMLSPTGITSTINQDDSSYDC